MTQIYLISPPRIEIKEFSKSLTEALKTKLIPVFQLRLKNYSKKEVEQIAIQLKKICNDNNCLFLLNDYYDIALNIEADGVHLGLEDHSIKKARQESLKLNKNFVIGASCYDSKHLAMEAGEQGADYISFGTFFPSKTKNSQGKPTVEILEWCNELINLPTVAIGGITDENCGCLVKSQADFLAVISYIWQNSLGITNSIKKLQDKIENSQ